MRYERLTKGEAGGRRKKGRRSPQALRPGTGNQKIDEDSEQVKKLTERLKRTGRPKMRRLL